MLYTVRRIMHLGLTDDIDGAVRIMKNMVLSLDKEYYSLNDIIDDLKKTKKICDKLKTGDDHLSFTSILSDVK